MKKYLTMLVIAGVSLYAGYKYGYSKAFKNLSDLADKEVESLKKFYESKQTPVSDLTVNPDSDISQEKKTSKKTKNVPLDEISKDKKNVDYGSQYRTETKTDRIVGTPKDEPIYLKNDVKINSGVGSKPPYVITPEEYAESNYETKTLFYYADKILADDDGNIIHDVGLIGGYSILEEMGIYEEYTLHVRDDEKGIDYEIILDERKYDISVDSSIRQ